MEETSLLWRGGTVQVVEVVCDDKASFKSRGVIAEKD